MPDLPKELVKYPMLTLDHGPTAAPFGAFLGLGLSARGREFLDKSRKRIREAASALAQITPPEAIPSGFGQVKPPLPSLQNDLSELVNPCRKEVQGLGVQQVDCLIQIQTTLLGEVQIRLEQVVAWLAALDKETIPGVLATTPASKELRATQLQLHATVEAFIKDVRNIFPQWNNLLSMQREFVTGFLALEKEAAENLDEAGMAEWRAEVDPVYFDFVRRVQLPLIDLGVTETKIMARASEIVTTAQISTAEGARDALIGWNRTIEQWIASDRGSRRTKGVLEGVLDSLLGERFGERLLTAAVTVGVIGVGLLALFWGGSYLYKRARGELER